MRSAPPAPRNLGRYVLLDEIASGGMATVHFARLHGHGGFERTVAVKRLHSYLANEPSFVAMLLDEARLASRIRHPNVVSTLDVAADGDEVFVVLEFVLGESLARLMEAVSAKGSGIAPDIASSIMVGALHGLHAAHETHNEQGLIADLVHRDVSPQNVLVGLDGIARVLDFGIAKARCGRIESTRQGVVKGKVGYMAPEQLRDEQVDRRVDVHAAAVVLWEMLTGRRLFKGESPESSMHLVLHKTVPPPSELVPGLPSALDEVVLRGLARDRELRYPTAQAMALALELAAPPAGAHRVGAWVEETAGAHLRALESRLAEIEQRCADSLGQAQETTVQEPLVGRAGEGTQPFLLKTSRTKRISLRLLAGIGTIGLVSAAVAGSYWMGAPHAPGYSTTQASAAATSCAVKDLDAVVHLASGPSARSTCAQREDGSMWCWGENASGQIGDGTTDQAPRARRVGKVDGARSIAVGNHHACVIGLDESVWCWGKGLLLRPAKVPGITRAEQLSCGGRHCCALMLGQPWCWGEGDRGQLGSKQKDAGLLSRVQRPQKALAVSAGSAHCCAIDASDGTVWCWGDNAFGQLGQGAVDLLQHPEPAQVPELRGQRGVVTGDKTTFSIGEDGEVHGWGFGVARPVLVKLSGVRQLAAGGKHNCALLEDGSVRCWGLNDQGQLGAAVYEDSADPIGVVGVLGAKGLVTGESHACALLKDGKAVCWGANDAGQLGRGAADDAKHASPEAVQAEDCRAD